jgi:hypothetical protein
MTHRVLLLTAAATLVLCTRLASAQPGPPSFDQIDKDKNGSLSKEEVAASFTERRAAAGGPPRGAGAGGPPGGGPPDPAQIFARWDTNGDGKVTKAEFDARPRPGGGPGAQQRPPPSPAR